MIECHCGLKEKIKERKKELKQYIKDEPNNTDTKYAITRLQELEFISEDYMK